jgi:hypothetical protein
VEEQDRSTYWSGLIHGTQEIVQGQRGVPPFNMLDRKITAIRETFEESGVVIGSPLVRKESHFQVPFHQFCQENNV